MRFVLSFLWLPLFLSANLPSYSHIDIDNVPLDKTMIQILKKQDGFFVEVGAHDGLFRSNTKLLEEYFGWRGLLVEPSLVAYEQCARNRPDALCYHCGLGSFEEEGKVIYGDFDGHPMSSVGGVRRGNQPTTAVTLYPLQKLLDENGISHIDFMSLDTEGYEYKILQGIDFNRTTFDYFLIELYPDEYDDVVQFLQSKGFLLQECLSRYSKAKWPQWDGTHNDYLFRRIDL